MNKYLSRRRFLTQSAAVAAAGVVAPSLLAACGSGSKPIKVAPVAWLDQAPDGPVLKAGLIGCGGRGTGAAINFLHAGPNLKITALADVFADRVDSCRKKLNEEHGQEIAPEQCFIGFDAYEKVLDSGVDMVILATPPYFRPQQIAAAVAARKHVFAEKPVCVDPVGARACLVAAVKAKEMGLTIVTGTQRHHQRDYVDIYNRVAAGAIGDIVGGNVYWNQEKLWHRDPQANWSEMECMIRNWVNWTWLSGDHIVEQHVHNLDVANWFAGGVYPVKAVGFGSRQRRVTGDQYDNFSVDYVYANGMHVHSMCRQINGCANNVSEWMQGTKGSTNCQNTIFDLKMQKTWEYTYPLDGDGMPTGSVAVSPYDQEHIDMVTAIRNNKPINELEACASSTMAAIMGRVSAYTGRETTWDEMLNSDMKLGPTVFAMGPVDVSKDVPVPGEAYIAK